ncbi:MULTISPECIES: tripartite tricarboxylate transporter substrate binding protein [unclassified Variovorax]|uniref:Bug family tripartite tricarboxylate transporter substrate binding protein n=1 Tax=unclassified Variovorax TaxID=663243 RepID=UPI0025765734|nr:MULTISPECIES: tripartite tricarboxylate transporter substrate binding protein [unclassified Variovorax]MDM0089252.1 tripartite tricarboxylate transporter substrate binding protein [Variovorax sp. J22G40]MDM0147325.1 tripartite tricarboxylate transporter substrate binding protein [Variovorax sp. J2P1-31]
MNKHLRILLLATAFTGSAFAQGYPTKPIRLVVPFSAGGSVDMVARMVGSKLGDSMGQPVLVDNRAGASGNIGMDFVAKSPADGYTLLMASAALTANMHLYAKMSFDPLKDLQPIIRVADQPSVLVVHPSLGVKNVQELIALARSKPGKLSFGSAGLGSAQQIAAEIFMMKTGTKMLHVPYKGGAPALADLVGGQIDLMFETSPTATPFVASGKLIGLAVTTPKRVSTLPELPTVAEAGVPGYEAYTWLGVVAPAGTPKAVVEKLNAEIKKAMTPEFRAELTKINLIPIGDTSADFTAFVKADSAFYANVVKQARIEPQ